MTEPFKSTSYQVGRILKALSSDVDGNLIFSDLPNPEGVTLSELIAGLIAGNIKFEAGNTFFTGAQTLQEVFQFLNTSAYLRDVGRFIYVDPTIENEKVDEGAIYNDINAAIQFANTLIYNGYNTVNIFLMGSHKEQGVLEEDTDIGVFNYSPTETWDPIRINNKGIRFIGLGNPVIRLSNFNGSEFSRYNLFEIDTNSEDNVSVLFQDISFEFVNCTHTSALKLLNCPINTSTKERSGFKIVNPTVSWFGGTNANNRLIDFSNSETQLISNVEIEGLKVGSINSVTSSLDEIELIYMDHNSLSVLNIDTIKFTHTDQPNSKITSTEDETTSFTGIKILSGTCVVSNALLDEKFYWNGVTYTNSITKFAKVLNNSSLSLNNIGIVRNPYNMAIENSGGLTTILDWVEFSPTATISCHGFDEIYSTIAEKISAGSITTSGTSATPSTTDTLYDVKPVKSFWNKNEIAFGIGDKNEIRLGLVDASDVEELVTYNVEKYGIPFWVNKTSKQLQYFNGINLITVGSGGSGGGGGGNFYRRDIFSSDFNITTYNFPGEYSTLGFEVIITHGLNLTDKYAFIYELFDTATSRKIEPQEIIAIDGNNIKLIMDDTTDVSIHITSALGIGGNDAQTIIDELEAAQESIETLLDGGVVSSVNNITGGLTLTAGPNIQLTVTGNSIEISGNVYQPDLSSYATTSYVTSFVNSSVTTVSGNLQSQISDLQQTTFKTLIGDGVSASITANHNLGSRDIMVQLYQNSSPWNDIDCDVRRFTENSVAFDFVGAPLSNSIRVIIKRID